MDAQRRITDLLAGDTVDRHAEWCYVGTSDPGLTAAITNGIAEATGTTVPPLKQADGFAVRVLNGQPVSVTYFKGNSDVHYGFFREDVQGSHPWTNGF